MNLQNLNFEHVEPSRMRCPPEQPLAPGTANPRPESNRSSQSEATVRPHSRDQQEDQDQEDDTAGTDSTLASSVRPASPSPPTVVVPRGRSPSATTLPPPRFSSLTSSSEPELYGPDRLFGPYPGPQVTRAYSRPIIIEPPLRRVPDLPVPPPYHQPMQWDMSSDANMASDFRDQLARLEGVVTPGIDNTPYVQYAIEALTRNRDRDTGYGDGDSSSSEYGTPFIPGPQPGYYQPYPYAPVPVPVPVPAPMPMPPAQTSGLYPTQPPPVRLPQDPVYYDPQHPEDLEPPRLPQDPRASAETLALSLKNGQRMVQPYEWRPVDRHFIAARVGGQQALSIPSLDFKPTALRTPSLVVLMLLCLAMIALLILAAVYSELHRGFLPYVSMYGGQYFLFRVLPPAIAAVLLLYAQFIITTIFRTLPFVRLASDVPEEREGSLFQDLYPKSFLRPQLIGTWHVWVPILVTWLANLTIPLHSALFTVILVGDRWNWATSQGVAWTLVALYLALLVATVIVWRYWANLETTGLIWDPRSLAEVAAMVSDTNVADDYQGTQVAKSRDGIRFALRRRAGDRLGYWTWKDGRTQFWYTLGSSLDHPNMLPVTQDQLAGQRMAKDGEKHGISVDLEQQLRASDIDIETSGRPARVRYRYLPWCLRSNQLGLFIATMAVLLVALMVVSFLPSTRVTTIGFLPALPSGPTPSGFSPADFLYSFLPSLLGMILFLLFQSLDMHLRVLQPWAALSGTERGVRAEHSMLADYAACAPIQSSVHALRNGHWRVAIVSFLSTLFVLIPVIAGAIFMALTPTDGNPRMYPNVPAFAVSLALLVLYVAALVALFPGRQHFRLPHGVACLAEVISFLANEDLLADKAFKQCRSREDMLKKMGLTKGTPVTQPRWSFGWGLSTKNVLGVRRAAMFTGEKGWNPMGVRKSQIRRLGRSRLVV